MSLALLNWLLLIWFGLIAVLWLRRELSVYDLKIPKFRRRKQ
jgi:hypothetical protein